MSPFVAEVSPAAAPSRRGAAALLAFAALAAVAFFYAFAVPYFLSTSYGPPEYAPRHGWLMLHIVGVTIALLTGPVQLWLGLADRGMDWHRRMGIGYLGGVALGSIGGYYMAIHTDFGFVFGAGLFSMATAWVLTTALAFLAIKRSLIEQHKEWMIRSYVVTFAFVTFRVASVALASRVGRPGEVDTVLAWAAWAMPLLVTEAILQGRKILAVQSMA